MAQQLNRRHILYRALNALRGQYAQILQDPLNSLSGYLGRQAGADGRINRRALGAVQGEANRILAAVFLGPDGRTALDDNGLALSPFARMLTRSLVLVSQDVVRAHSNYLAAALDADTYRWLSAWTISNMRIPGANPLAQYEAPHLWLDPKGYRLSDRIWQTSQRTRTQLDNLLTEGINRGRAASDIAKDAERFLRPDRAAFRTTRPYGRDASFDAMRLARTEIARAHAQATSIAASMNPFVGGIDWGLSASHPRFDICDGLATLGMGGGRIKPPYDIRGSYPLPVASSHPLCLCFVTGVVVEDRSAVVARLRQSMQAGEAPPLTPAAGNGKVFLSLMLGGLLLNEPMEAA